VTTLRLVLDCTDVDAQARFWTAALGYRQAGAAGQYVNLGPSEGAVGPHLLLQGVPEPKVAKIRLHLDLLVEDVDAEVARLEALGAARAPDEPFDEHGHQWVVMTDPEGNEFCVCAN
jgi:predicted enzyme related to lactoylglutathione lyase